MDVEKVMIWHEYEAYLLQVKQIGTSACGPTAVLTVLVGIVLLGAPAENLYTMYCEKNLMHYKGKC